jgi:signal transduction histidine kinase
MSIPEDEFLGATNELRNISIAITIISIIIGVGIAAVLLRSLTAPIKKLIEMSEEISKGNLDSRVDIKTSDEIGQLAKTLNFAVGKMQESQKRKDEFAGMISHELKTPLVPIRGYLEMLKNPKFGELSQDQKEAVEEIYTNTLHLEKLITNILISEKLELGEIVYYNEKIDVKKFMDEQYNLLSPLMIEKNIKFTNSTRVKDAFADPKIVKDIFASLVENAVGFVPDSDGKIEIGVTDGENKVTFYVKDNGIGISKENQKGLFKQFHQVDTSHTRKHGGTGLGLAICKGYVEGLGGKIWLESEENKGTTFFFTVPKTGDEKK